MQDAAQTPADAAGAEDAAVDAFIARWQGVTASEPSTSQSFLIDLCRLLGVARERDPEQARFAADDDADGTPGAEQESAAVPVMKAQPWPKDTVDQVRAVADVLAASPVPLSLDEIGATFTARGPWKKRLPKPVEMLVALGRAQEQEGGYVSG